MKTYTITIPTQDGLIAVEMSGKDIVAFHEKLTAFYNEHYEEIHSEAE